MTLKARELQSAALAAPGNKVLLDRRGGRVAGGRRAQSVILAVTAPGKITS